MDSDKLFRLRLTFSPKEVSHAHPALGQIYPGVVARIRARAHNAAQGVGGEEDKGGGIGVDDPGSRLV